MGGVAYIFIMILFVCFIVYFLTGGNSETKDEHYANYFRVSVADIEYIKRLLGTTYFDIDVFVNSLTYRFPNGVFKYNGGFITDGNKSYYTFIINGRHMKITLQHLYGPCKDAFVFYGFKIDNEKTSND